MGGKPENGKVHGEEHGKEDDEVLAFAFALRSKPVDESFHPGKDTAGGDDGDDAGVEEFPTCLLGK